MEEDKFEEFEKEKKSLKIKYIFLIIIIAIISAVAASEFTLYYYTKDGLINKEELSSDKTKNIEAISETLKSFRTVIDEYYIGEIDEQKMLDETIKGYVNGLDDEYSEYMTAEEWQEFQADALGNYVGIGIYMSVDKNGNVVVVSPIKDTPAEKAGLKTGDIIVYVNDESMIGIDSEVVSSKIKGEEGTKVKITVLRGEEYIDFDIERKAIKVYHVESEMLENNIGYISLLTFDEGCAEEFKNAYLDLESKGAKKIIIDLRNNTGGLVNECLEIADMILPKGDIELITLDAKGNKDISKSSKDPIVEGEIVVLVNEYSASASEILVAALKENNKAEVVGKTTYGKGVIQSVLSLNDGSVLKLTVSEYFTPTEQKINKVGITPDYEVDLPEDLKEDTQLNKAIELLK
ncbi:MAG: S41 family peptidase [Clostridia bacterium]|nr:S41 family peptidase [Clostridia bacterium]